MNAEECRDIYEIFTERHRASSMIITSNRDLEEWIATFADQIRSQSAIYRFSGNSYDFLI
jgi:DNA replication protein DnaC